jgi:IS5 family transposase
VSLCEWTDLARRRLKQSDIDQSIRTRAMKKRRRMTIEMLIIEQDHSKSFARFARRAKSIKTVLFSHNFHSLHQSMLNSGHLDLATHSMST